MLKALGTGTCMVIFIISKQTKIRKKERKKERERERERERPPFGAIWKKMVAPLLHHRFPPNHRKMLEALPLSLVYVVSLRSFQVISCCRPSYTTRLRRLTVIMDHTNFFFCDCFLFIVYFSSMFL